MIKSSVAVIGISAVLLAFAMFAFFPAITVNATGTCTITGSDPSGTYSPGQTISATVSTTNCAAGSGTWQLCNNPFTPGNAVSEETAELSCASGIGVVQSGSFTCTSAGTCTPTPLFTDTASATSGVSCSTSTTCNLGPGQYEYVADFQGSSTQAAFTASILVVTPQFPAGVILGLLAPVAALIGYAKFRKPAFMK